MRRWVKVAPWLGAGIAILTGALVGPSAAAAPAPGMSLEQALSFPFITGVVGARNADAIAWVRVRNGMRNVWYAHGPDFKPRQLTESTNDDGQELTWLSISDDGGRIIYVRGGDHDANWPSSGNLAPDPDSSPAEPKVEIWAVSASGGAPVKLAEGDAPAQSTRGVVAFVKDGQVWTTLADGKGKAERLFFDRGKAADLAWSPDGRQLAFVSRRGDHAFIGVYSAKDQPILYLAPSTGRDGAPKWSPDGRRIAFTRRPGEGGPPEPIRVDVPQPWSIWVADAASGAGRKVWASGAGLSDSYPGDVDGEANLDWAAGDRLVFLSEADNWPHLYSVGAEGAAAVLLTPGPFMVEHVGLTRDRRTLIFDANTGAADGDGDRRHLFADAADRPAMQPLTSGEGVEWKPMQAAADEIAFVGAGYGAPAAVDLVKLNGEERRTVAPPELDAGYPAADFIKPRPVTWSAPDGQTVHGQLFERPGAGLKPGVIFVHGGPPRQMLLGWHYMDYYSNSYAMNQYMATHGFVVLSVNYRLGIGYGRAYQHPEHAGLAGASEYQDVLSGARYLQGLKGVDPTRIGIWGGSYGGYLTGLALARNSDVFKAGVDMHGIHDWTGYFTRFLGHPDDRYEQGDRAEAMAVAWAASPDADVAKWTSPVLLIQGDDDRNVDFHQTVDISRRLDAKGVHYEELVLPNEIHGFLRYGSWLKADAATVDFLTRELGAKAR